MNWLCHVQTHMDALNTFQQLERNGGVASPRSSHSLSLFPLQTAAKKQTPLLLPLCLSQSVFLSEHKISSDGRTSTQSFQR